MQAFFYCPHSLLTPEASSLAVTHPSHYQQAERLGQNAFISPSTVAIDLFHRLFLLPAFLPPLTSYYLLLKVLSFLSPYARYHEGTALSLSWASVAHTQLCSKAELDRLMMELLFFSPSPEDGAGLAISSPIASSTAENVFTSTKITVVPMSAWAPYARGEPLCCHERAPMFWGCASMPFPPMLLWSQDKSSTLECSQGRGLAVAAFTAAEH